MQRPYYDSYSYRYAEAQLENERLRRHIRDLKQQVQNLKWYSSDLSTEKSKNGIRHAEESRHLHSKINNLEFLATDLKHENFLTRKEADLEIKRLNEEIDRCQNRIKNLEWLNDELHKDKSLQSKQISDLEYKAASLSTDNYKTLKQLDEEKRRTETLERLNSSLNSDYYNQSLELKEREKKLSELEYRAVSLESENHSKDTQLRQSSSRIESLLKEKSHLASENYLARKDLETSRSRVNDLEIHNSVLNRSLDEERNESSYLRSANSDLRTKKVKYERKLQKHEQMFRTMYNDSMRQLEDSRNQAITAEKNLELSRVDPGTFHFDYVDRKYETLRLNNTNINATVRDIKDRLSKSVNDISDLNSSTAFTNYYENKYGTSPKQDLETSRSKLYDDIERDLRMYRMERSLNDSLERLKKWQRETSRV